MSITNQKALAALEMFRKSLVRTSVHSNVI